LKIKRIRELALNYFVDDLEEVFNESEFPIDTKSFLIYKSKSQNPKLKCVVDFSHIKEFVAKQESSDTHKNDLKNLERYTMGAKDKKTGEVNPEKINKEYKNAYAETLKRVEERKEGWNTAVEDARKEKDLAFGRIKSLNSAAPNATNTNTAPASSGESTTGEFKPPNTAQIAALKANPQQAAAFDLKFGPGAANEYLGK
jgi:hypothetical protein